MSQDPAHTPAEQDAQAPQGDQQVPAPAAKKPRASTFTAEFWTRARVIYAGSDTLSPAKAAAQAAQEMGLPKPPHHSSAAERADREKWSRGGGQQPEATHAAQARPVASALPAAQAQPVSPGDAAPAQPEVDHMAGLTAPQVIFVNAYLTNLNGTRAYMEAKPGCKETVAATESWRLLRNPKVAAAIHQRMAERIKRMEVDQDEVLRRYLTRLEADPRELVEFHRGACRYCFGVDHLYQFTPAELAQAKAKHESNWKLKVLKSKGALSDADMPDFDEQGGLGFDARLEPNPECPECHGDGAGRVVIKDTRHLSPGALALYGGVEEGKDGIKVRIGNRDDALLQVARHTGFFEADNEQIATVVVSPEQLDAVYEAKMAEGRAKSTAAKSRMDRILKTSQEEAK